MKYKTDLILPICWMCMCVGCILFWVFFFNEKSDLKAQLAYKDSTITRLCEEIEHKYALYRALYEQDKQCEFELLIMAIIDIESGGNPNATNGRDNGLMQIDNGVFCPEQNIIDGSKILAELIVKTANIECHICKNCENCNYENIIHRSLTSYNRGWTGANRYYAKHNKFDSEYSKKVLKKYKEYKEK